MPMMRGLYERDCGRSLSTGKVRMPAMTRLTEAGARLPACGCRLAAGGRRPEFSSAATVHESGSSCGRAVTLRLYEWCNVPSKPSRKSTVGDHRKLEIYNLACELSDRVDELVGHLPPKVQTRLGDELLRAAESIHLNIAEGCGFNSDALLKKHIKYAIASANEVEDALAKAASPATSVARGARSSGEIDPSAEEARRFPAQPEMNYAAQRRQPNRQPYAGSREPASVSRAMIWNPRASRGADCALREEQNRYIEVLRRKRDQADSSARA